MRRGKRNRGRPPRKRPASYYRVDGFDLREEMLRLCGLPVFAGQDSVLARTPPELAVRRASRKPHRNLGFAIPSERRISVTAYPGIRRGDLEEVLLHELVHIAVGRNGRSWHGATFNRTLKRAMCEGYGVTGVKARGSIHGAYADAIERRRTPARPRGGGVHPNQLAIDTAF
ncbi:MAG: hypothetical protein AABM29_05745 [Actinomycetota bacterium]